MKSLHVRMRVAIFCVVILIFLLSAAGSQEFPITTHESAQKYPAIYGDVVVWQDNRNGNWDIYGYNLATQEEFQITTHPADQTHPAIHGNIVVWEDHRCFEGEGDNCWFALPYAIYGYNLTTQEEFQVISTPDWKSSFAWKSNPVICGDIVMWQEHRSSYQIIAGIALSTRETFQVGEPLDEQRNPAIYGDIVIWEDGRELYPHGYNMSTKEEFQISPGHQFLLPARGGYSPALYEDMVIWLETYEGIIYGYDLSEKRGILIGTASMWECDPITGSGGRVTPRSVIYKDYVIWVDCRKGNPDLFGYNLSTGEEFEITTDPSSQTFPAIHEDIVVWQDNRNENWDIYGCYLHPPFIHASTKSRTWVILDAIGTRGLEAFLIFIPAAFCALIAFSAGKSVWFWHRTVNHRPEAPAITPKDFKRNALSTVPFILVAAPYAFLVYSSVLNSELFSGILSSGICVCFIICYIWAKRTPCIRIADDKIVLFRILRKPRAINLNSVRKVTVRKLIGIPYRVDLVLSDSTGEVISLFSLSEKDKEVLNQTLNQTRG